MAPLVRRTWALRGHTPILYQKTRSHKKVSMIAALTVPPRRKRIGIYFSLYPDRNIASLEVVKFLRQLRQQIQKPLFIIWDRLLAHRSKRVQKSLRRQNKIKLFFLPPYAPELNPTEFLWNYLKHNSLANYAAEDTSTLSRLTVSHTRKIRRRPELLRSFLYATPLFLRPK